MVSLCARLSTPIQQGPIQSLSCLVNCRPGARSLMNEMQGTVPCDHVHNRVKWL